MLHSKYLHLEANSPEETIVAMLKALASQPRWRILRYLSEGGRTVNEIARALDLPSSTAAAQIRILEEAGFLETEFQPAAHGLEKVCTRTFDSLVLQFPYLSHSATDVSEVSMPVGAYTSFEITPTCGLASERALIGYLDDPLSFYEPERIRAGLIWFRSGYVEYTFPKRLPRGSRAASVLVSMEICSEAPLHDVNWPSDITLWINGREIGTWTCPGDFGGRRGRLTPQWWDSKDSQFGVLKRWLVATDGSFIDGHPLSSVTISDLDIEATSAIRVRVGVKADAQHVGGVNLFGSSFGNYPQDMTLRISPTQRRRQGDGPFSIAG